MKPSRKILLGGSALALGILIQLINATLIPQFVESYAGTAEMVPHSEVDMQTTHEFYTLLFAGACLRYLLLAVGLVLILVGVYQTAKTTERGLPTAN